MQPFEYVRASSTERALEALAGAGPSGAAPKGGGVDLLDLAKERILPAGRLVDLGSIPGVDSIESRGGGFRLGGGVRLATLASHEGIRRAYPALAHAAEEAATPQIRNRATVAGNLCQRPRCWYFRQRVFDCLKRGGSTCPALEGRNELHAIFDPEPCPMVHPSNLAVPLIALEATLALVGPEGERTIPVAELFVTPSVKIETETSLRTHELITAIEIPPPIGTNRYREIRHRESFDWPIVSAAARATVDGKRLRDVRLVLGAVAPVPRRAREAEAILEGQGFSPELASKAARAAFEAARPLSRNASKVQIGETLLIDLLTSLVS